jgi:hypothetical protein
MLKRMDFSSLGRYIEEYHVLGYDTTWSNTNVQADITSCVCDLFVYFCKESVINNLGETKRGDPSFIIFCGEEELLIVETLLL